MKELFKFSEQPEFKNPSLIVGWERDAGDLSPKVIDYLKAKIEGRNFCEIESASFFSLAGVSIQDDVAQFPESKFYCGKRKDLVIFKSSEPRLQRYRFLNTVLDIAATCKVKELFTVSGTVSPIAHTSPRKILAVFNHPGIQQKLSGFNLEDMTWEGPPAISSYLLWLAKKRGIPGVSLWTEMPFYLAASQDLLAIKVTLSFLNKRFNLGLDLEKLDKEIKNQNMELAQLREEDPKINKDIGMLEAGISLSEEEQMELVEKTTEIFEKRG